MLAECQQKRKIITLLSVRDAVKRDVPKRVIGYRGEKKKRKEKEKEKRRDRGSKCEDHIGTNFFSCSRRRKREKKRSPTL